ncbi:DcrB-related protein [Planctomycetota bacterium]
MTQTMFGYPLDLAEGWEDRSVYTYYLKGTEEPTQSAMPVGVSLAASAQKPGTTFQSNVVVVREPDKGRDLGNVVDEQRRTLQEKVPTATMMRSGDASLAGQPAREQEYRINLDHPLPTLIQLHVSVAREGYFYHFCCTSTQQRYDGDKEKFRAFMTAWG